MAYREKLGSGLWSGGRKARKWAKRSMSKFRRRLGKRMVDLPPTSKLTKGYYW